MKIFFLSLILLSSLAHAGELTCRIQRNQPHMGSDHLYEFKFDQSSKSFFSWDYKTSFGLFEINTVTFKVPGEDPLYPHGQSIIAINADNGSVHSNVYQGQLNYQSPSHGSFMFTDSEHKTHFLSFDCF